MTANFLKLALFLLVNISTAQNSNAADIQPFNDGPLKQVATHQNNSRFNQISWTPAMHQTGMAAITIQSTDQPSPIVYQITTANDYLLSTPSPKQTSCTSNAAQYPDSAHPAKHQGHKPASIVWLASGFLGLGISRRKTRQARQLKQTRVF